MARVEAVRADGHHRTTAEHGPAVTPPTTLEDTALESTLLTSSSSLSIAGRTVAGGVVGAPRPPSRVCAPSPRQLASPRREAAEVREGVLAVQLYSFERGPFACGAKVALPHAGSMETRYCPFYGYTCDHTEHTHSGDKVEWCHLRPARALYTFCCTNCRGPAPGGRAQSVLLSFGRRAHSRGGAWARPSRSSTQAPATWAHVGTGPPPLSPRR